jgi:DNA-3-methyladenine glycosylase I
MGDTAAPQASAADGPRDGLIERPDGRRACWWAADDPLLSAYHDQEWGRRVHDEDALFERLCLEAFQAGLSWRTVLLRRDALREAFHGFDPREVARLTPDDMDRIATDPRIIRHRGKIAAVVANASTLLAMHERGVTLADLIGDDALRRATDRPAPRTRDDVPTTSPGAHLLARRLRDQGWRFIGPTSAYALLQAVGVVDDHLVGCLARRDD